MISISSGYEVQDQRWRLADGELAVALLGTLQLRDRVLVDELADRRAAAGWLRRHRPTNDLDGAIYADLVALREILRKLLTATIEGAPPPAGVVRTVNEYAARAPITLVAHETAGGALHVEAIRQGTSADALLADVARSAMVLLTPPERDHVGLCHAPGCILFFLKRHARQQWCSPGCGNRARVARHYNRHIHQ